MGFFDKIYKSDKPKADPLDDLDAVESEAPVSRRKGKGTTTVAPANMAISGIAMTGASGSPFAVQPDPQIVADLEAMVTNATKPEYTQFRAFFENLSALPEADRYKTALNIAKVSKIEGAAVLAAMDTRIAALDAAEKSFGSDVESAHNEQVVAKRAKAEELNVEVKRLQEQIAKIAQDAATALSEATDAENRLKEQDAVFDASLNVVKQSLVAERDRMASFVTPSIVK